MIVNTGLTNKNNNEKMKNKIDNLNKIATKNYQIPSPRSIKRQERKSLSPTVRKSIRDNNNVSKNLISMVKIESSPKKSPTLKKPVK